MNKLLSSTLLGLMVLLAAACKQDTQTPTGPQTVLPLSSGGSTAHPALAWPSYVSSNNNQYSNLMVSDTDASHQTSILRAWANTNSIQYFNPSWSSSGGSLAFAITRFGGAADSVYVIDVSDNSHGTPVGSNLRGICALPSGVYLDRWQGGLAWSSTSSMGEIAFIGNKTVYVVSSSGGTPTAIFSQTTLGGPSGISWSPDDSRLAITRWDSAWGHTILIFNTSTWSVVDSISVGNAQFGKLAWSRSGANKLAFGMTTRTWNGSAWTYASGFYYCDPTTGATPSGGYTGDVGQWSPNNTSLIYPAATSGNWYLVKVPAYGTSATQLGSIPISVNNGFDWKR